MATDREVKQVTSSDIDVAGADALLMTTRSVRRRLDRSRPVPPSLIRECVEVALQAPMSGGVGEWGGLAFVAVGDPAKKSEIARLYREGMVLRLGSEPTAAEQDERLARAMRSSAHLLEHLDDVPWLVIACVRGRIDGRASALERAARYGSVLPATWSFMLAARARGLGAAWTTAHLNFEAEVGTLLAIPQDWMQVAMLPVAFDDGGPFRAAARPPVEDVLRWDAWS